MRAPRFAAAAVAVLAVTACSLFTDLDGLDNGASSSSSSSGGADAGDGGGSSSGGNGEGGPNAGVDGGDASIAPPQQRALVVVGGYKVDDAGNSIDLKSSAASLIATTNGNFGPFKEDSVVGLGGSYDVRVVSYAGRVLAVSAQSTYVGTVDKNTGNVAWTVQSSPGRDGTCVAISGGSIYAFGGNTGGNVSPDVTVSPATLPLSWTPTRALPIERQLHGCAATDTHVYVVAGKNSAGVHQNTVYVAKRESANGALGSWQTTVPLPATAYWPRVVVAGGRLLVLGAEWDAPATAETTYVATINADGTVGAWGNGAPLPFRRWDSAAAVNGNDLYVISGGEDARPIASIYVSKIDQSGSMTPWLTAPFSLPIARVKHGATFVSLP